ncbi:hypothetical protein Mapa_014535 [Marchantia paleacea]|nr:hypothetical protein Mapa_014535 [Marchantia paleacea]
MKLRCDILEMQSGLSILNIVLRWWRIFMSETHILYIICGRPKAELSLSCTLWSSSSLMCSFKLSALVVILSLVTVILSTTISSLRWYLPNISVRLLLLLLEVRVVFRTELSFAMWIRLHQFSMHQVRARARASQRGHLWVFDLGLRSWLC